MRNHTSTSTSTTTTTVHPFPTQQLALPNLGIEVLEHTRPTTPTPAAGRPPSRASGSDPVAATSEELLLNIIQ